MLRTQQPLANSALRTQKELILDFGTLINQASHVANGRREALSSTVSRAWSGRFHYRRDYLRSQLKVALKAGHSGKSSKENKGSSNIGNEKSNNSVHIRMGSNLVSSSALSNLASPQEHTSQRLNEQPNLQHNFTAVHSRLLSFSSPIVYSEEAPNINAW